MNKTFTAMLIIVLLFGNIAAQQNPKTTIKPPEISAELRKNAVDFLRQTIKEIPNLKAEENRQYFTIETARLLWKYDEKEARAMFERAMQDLINSYSNIVSEARKANIKIDGYSDIWSNSTKPLTQEQIRLFSTFRTVSENQKLLLNLLISSDPEMAYQFFSQTPNFPRNSSDSGYYSSYQPSMKKRRKSRDKNSDSPFLANISSAPSSLTI